MILRISYLSGYFVICFVVLIQFYYYLQLLKFLEGNLLFLEFLEGDVGILLGCFSESVSGQGLGFICLIVFGFITFLVLVFYFLVVIDGVRKDLDYFIVFRKYSQVKLIGKYMRKRRRRLTVFFVSFSSLVTFGVGEFFGYYLFRKFGYFRIRRRNLIEISGDGFLNGLIQIFGSNVEVLEVGILVFG